VNGVGKLATTLGTKVGTSFATKAATRIATSRIALLAVALAASPRHASAYDPATTHAGLTQRAALASTLHATLARRFGRPLGLFEPVAFRADLLPEDQGRFLNARLAALDPSGGYRPGDDGVATALGWLVAGSVIAWTPAERGQNSFLDPTRGAGLAEGGGLGGLGQSLRLLLDGGSLRGWATGTDFDLTGAPSTTWLQSGHNDVGLPSLYDQLELGIAGGDAAVRNTALARALMALGGVVAVLQDVGEPARVRNDFRGAFLQSNSSGSPGPFNRSSAFERFVADNYGVAGVPAAGKPIDRPTVMAFFTAADAQGLADRTQRRFFSDGTLPEDGVVDRGTTPQEIVRSARDSLVFGLPGLPRLELREMGRKHYVYALGEERQGRLVLTSAKPPVARAPAGSTASALALAGAAAPPRRLLAYQRVPGRVRFFLDRGVYEDTARVLLPEIGAFSAGLIDLLLRGEAAIKIDGATAQVSVTGARGNISAGKLRVFAQDKSGVRREIGSWPASAVAGGQVVSVSVPAGTHLLAAVLRGQDDAGVLVAGGEQLASTN
jgi:hypothetical protein